MCLCDGAKTSARVDSELSEEFEAKVRMHQGSMLPPFLFAVVVDVVTELAREGAQSELQCADDLVLMSVTMEGHRNKFLKWKEAFESMGLKVQSSKEISHAENVKEILERQWSRKISYVMKWKQ